MLRNNNPIEPATEQQLQYLHYPFRILVNKVGGMIKVRSNQVRLNQYLNSSVLQKKALLNDNLMCKEV